MAGTVFSMIRQLLEDSEEKLASEKTAAQAPAPPVRQEPVQELSFDAEKIANACDYLADHLHEVVDSRTPQEKLAEYIEIQRVLQKMAEDGDEPKGEHQTTEAEPGSISPMTVSPDDSGTGVGAGNAIPSEQNNAQGTSLDAGESGEATPGNQPPMDPSTTESAYPNDGGNSLATNAGERPGGGGEAPQKIAARARVQAQQRAVKLAQLVGGGQIRKEAAAFIIAKDQEKVAALQKKAFADAAIGAVAGQMHKNKRPGWGALGGAVGGIPGAALSLMGRPGLGIPLTLAGGALGGYGAASLAGPSEEVLKKASSARLSTIISKLAEDALFPAQISAGTEPELQSGPGADSSAQSQGTEAGEGTPDTRGSDPGRELIDSVTAAINATKEEAKRSARSEMAKYLDEPALSAAHDKVLSTQLDNTSSAGVKIAAARALLENWVGHSPENRQRLTHALSRVKQANAGMMDPGMAGGAMPAGGAAPGAMPGMANPGGLSAPMPGAKTADMGEAPAQQPVSDGALSAAAEGVTPEELAAAMSLLEQQEGAAAMAAQAQPPPALAPSGGGAPPEASPQQGSA